MMPFKSKMRGFTIIEVLVATTVLILAFSTIMALMIQTIQVNRFTRTDIIGNGLIQEGAEMMRALRDSRWKQCPEGSSATCWKEIAQEGGVPDPDTTYRIGRDFSQEGFPIILEALPEPEDGTFSEESRLYYCKWENGEMYVHEEMSVACDEMEPTRIFREIGFNDQEAPDMDGQAMDPDDFLLVKTRVFWEEAGAITYKHNMDFALYNWKPQ